MREEPGTGNLVMLKGELYIVGAVSSNGISLLSCDHARSTTHVNLEPKEYKKDCPECLSSFYPYDEPDPDCEVCKGEGRVSATWYWLKDLKFVADNLVDYLRDSNSVKYKGLNL